jgi:hypothetical protein
MKMSKNDRIALMEDFQRNFATKVEVTDMKTDLINFKRDIKAELNKFKTGVLRWWIICCITLLLAILGLYFEK